MIKRVVFDTSTLVGAILRTGSVPYQALSLALNQFELCVSLETIAELEAVLARQQFAKYVLTDARAAFVELVRKESTVWAIDALEASDLKPHCRDASDQKFLALAIAAQADAIVSSDHDLLVLHPWQEIAILTPAQFLVEFGE